MGLLRSCRDINFVIGYCFENAYFIVKVLNFFLNFQETCIYIVINVCLSNNSHQIFHFVVKGQYLCQLAVCNRSYWFESDFSIGEFHKIGGYTLEKSDLMVQIHY